MNSLALKYVYTRNEQESVLEGEIRSTEAYLTNWEKKSSEMFRWQCGILAFLLIGTYLV